MKGIILIIDDNPVDVKVMSRLVESSGFGSEGCLDATRVEEHLRKAIPRVIFLDLQMPGISGYDMISRLRRDHRTSHVPIIIVSGKNQMEDVRKAIALGANDYVIKPIDALVLQEKLSRYEIKTDDEFRLVQVNAPKARQASLRKPVEIDKLSEFGVELRSDFPIKKGETVELADLLPVVFGQERVMARCLSVTENAGHWNAQLTFVGLSEVARHAIRKACRQMWIDQSGRAS